MQLFFQLKTGRPVLPWEDGWAPGSTLVPIVSMQDRKERGLKMDPLLIEVQIVVLCE